MSTTPLKKNDNIVKDLQQLFQIVVEKDFEKKVCDALDTGRIVDIARRYNVDRVGVEVVNEAINTLVDLLPKKTSMPAAKVWPRWAITTRMTPSRAAIRMSREPNSGATLAM